MTCGSCGRANRPSAKFCGGCGHSLAPRCARCGAESPGDAQFCDSCGAPLALLAAAAAEASARKVVTIVFADLVGSVSLHERLDAESARRFTARYHEAMSAAVRGHGGTVVQLLGDGVLAAFGAPRVAEDDALRGVRAAVAMQTAFRELLREQSALVGAVGLRIAVNTGEVIVSEDQTSVIGDPTNVASRLQQEARDGDILIGESTQRLVAEQVTLAPLGSFALRGRAEPVSAFRVVSLEAPAAAQGTAFVGREEELRRLRAVFDAAVAGPGARLAVLLGSPGLGKSRLLGEFGRRLGDRANVLSARCDPARGRTFAPLAAALRARLGVGDSADREAARAAVDAVVGGPDPERARVAAGVVALLSGAPASPEETFFVVRRLFATLAAERPVVLVFDDVQWAEPLLLDLAEHLVQWSSGVPLLVLLGSRPELRELRSALATPGGVVSELVTLAGLDAGSAMRLAANAIGADELPAALVGRVLAASEGNPLFVGELVRMLVHDGVLRRDGERWITAVELARLEMPPTIHALLAARIERLGPEERTLLERAAVVGRHFSRAAVAELVGRDPRELDARLESLRRSELIEPDTGWFLGEPALRFHHALIRDAAYRRVLRQTRADLHARLADWITARAGGNAEHDEVIGWHLEQAHEHLRELGPLDATGWSLGSRAAKSLGAAGRRALARDDLRVAADLLGRALACLDAADPARADLALDWCEALLSAGEVGPGTRALAELSRFTGGSERLRGWHACFAGELAVLADPQALRATAESVAAAAAALAAAGDVAGEAKAHAVHATALARLGQIGASEAALERALAAARLAGDRRRANSVLAGAPIAQLFGPSPVARASGRCLDVVRVLRITQGAPAVEAVALRCQAVLEALRGRADAARRMIAAARRTVEELGVTSQLLEVEFFAGYIELLEGDPEAAARCLSAAYAGLREHGLNIDAARAAALLARTRLAQGDAVGAEVLSHESESLAGDDLNAAIAWRGVRAEALAQRGEHAAAVEFARAAVEIASATDALLHHANARLALATALRAAGRGVEGDAEEERAIELWEAKGATLLVERARRAPARPRTAPGASEASEPAAPAHASVAPNRATRHTAAAAAAMTARDLDALGALYADDVEFTHHRTASVHGRAGLLAWIGVAVAESETLQFRSESLASLGEALGLFRVDFRASAMDGSISVGAVGDPGFLVTEVGPSGRASRIEFFAEDRLGDAITRLYERHAELLPAGPARERAALIARAAEAMLTPPDLVRMAAVLAPSVEAIDRRRLGTWSAHGAEAHLRHVSALLDVASPVAFRQRDLLALRADAFLTRMIHHGVERAGGGAYERPYLMLIGFGSDGRIARIEYEDDERAAAALTRFEAQAPADRTAPRRIWANLATAADARVQAAFAARDLPALATRFAEDFVAVHRPTGTLTDRRGPLDEFGELMRARDLSISMELLATLGAELALFRRSRSFSSLDEGERGEFGPTSGEDLLLIEADAREVIVRTEIFAEDRLGDAIVRLYERRAERLPGGDERLRAAGTARAVAGFLAVSDPATLEAVVAPGLTWVDHRPFGMGPSRGAESFLSGLRSLFELASELSFSVDEILGLRADALLVRRTNTGTERSGGGEFERRFLSLARFDAPGLITHWELFEVEAAEEALTRFEELVAPVARFANAATRALERFERAWRARDWQRVAATFARDHLMDDRRALFRIELAGADFLANERLLFEVEASQWHSELLATRGERLALVRAHFSARADGGGPMAVEMIDLVEVDEHGRRTALVVFDPDDADAAWEELDDRFGAGEAAPYAQVWARRRAVWRARELHDWPLLGSLYAPDIVTEDHRPALLGTLRSRDELIDWFRSLVELAPDAGTRVTHVLGLDDRQSLHVMRVYGTRDGGPFETVLAILQQTRPDGLAWRDDLYDLGQLDEARARFAALRRDLLRIPPNAAVSVGAQLHELFEARDWAALEERLAPGFVFDDRRRHIQLAWDRAQYLANARSNADRLRFNGTLLATGGERIALSRDLLTGGRDPAELEVEVLSLTEVDAEERLVAVVLFDPGDRRAASLELLERRARSEPKLPLAYVSFIRAYNAQDPAAVRAAVRDDYVLDDHRRTGVGRLEGADAYLPSLAPLFESSRSYALETVCELAAHASGVLAVTRAYGTLLEGGEFESVFLRVTGFERDFVLSNDLYELEDLERAKARFEELRPDPLRIPPNAATEKDATLLAALEARDWAALRVLASRDFRFEDRRKAALVSGGVELYVRNLAFVVENPVQRRLKLLAAPGERLALQRLLYAGTLAGGGAFEGGFLRLIELDADGLFRAVIHFDPDDRRAASLELSERYWRGEGAGVLAPASIENARAINASDLGRLRASLCDDFVFDDHRRTGVGRLVGAAAYMASVPPIPELVADQAAEIACVVAAESHCDLVMARRLGRLRDGGAYESLYLRLTLVRGDRVAAIELFEPEDLAVAKARFAELRPDLLRIPANAASRSSEVVWERLGADDWETLRAITHPDLWFDDRRRRSLVQGGIDTYLANLAFLRSNRRGMERELLATAGDRLSLQRTSYFGSVGWPDYEGEVLMVVEVDAEGRRTAVVFFDPEDRVAAWEELFERRERQAGSVRPAGWRRLIAALRAGDLAAARAILPDDFCYDDHRRTGPGRLGRDDYVAWLAELFRESADAGFETLYELAREHDAVLSVNRTQGTLSSGGPFEYFYLLVGTPRAFELFELDDLELARARFEELRQKA